MKRTPLLLAALIIAVVVAGCVGNKYRPLDVQVRAMGHEEARARLLPVLIGHLAQQRGYAFATGYLRGTHAYAGSRTTEDGSTTVFLFEATGEPDLKWSYMLFSFGDKPYMLAQENTSPEARAMGTTDDGDGEFRGLYKLTIMNARYCSGDTKEMPVIEGNAVRISITDRLLRKSMLKDMRQRYTPTYCQDARAERPEMAGVRFYFDTKESLEEFASVLLGAFPQVRYSGGTK